MQATLKHSDATVKGSLSPKNQMVIGQGMEWRYIRSQAKPESKVGSLHIIARLIKGLAPMALHSFKIHLRNTKSPMLILALTENDIMWKNIHIDDSKSDSGIPGSN